jgi:hypothetical protein
MRIARQAPRAVRRGGNLTAVVRQVARGQPPLQERARIHARRALCAWKNTRSPPCASVRARKKWLKPTSNRSAALAYEAMWPPSSPYALFALAVCAVRAHHHRQRVPAHDRRQPLLDSEVAGKRRLLGGGHGVHVRRGQLGRPAEPQVLGQPAQLVEDETRAGRAVRGQQRGEGVLPLRRLGRIDVDGGPREEARLAVIGHVG